MRHFLLCCAPAAETGNGRVGRYLLDELFDMKRAEKHFKRLRKLEAAAADLDPFCACRLANQTKPLEFAAVRPARQYSAMRHASALHSIREGTQQRDTLPRSTQSGR